MECPGNYLASADQRLLGRTGSPSFWAGIADPLRESAGLLRAFRWLAVGVVLIWMVVYLSLSLLTSSFMNWYNSRMKLVER